MANLNEIAQVLDPKSISQIKQMYAYAKANNFDIGWRDQSSDQRPRIFITIYPEGKANYNPFKRQNTATWYFYLNKENLKDNGGAFSQPEIIRGNTKSYKNFDKFMVELEKRYNEKFKISNIADSIIKQSIKIN
jgi:hypothetical protein